MLHYQLAHMFFVQGHSIFAFGPRCQVMANMNFRRDTNNTATDGLCLEFVDSLKHVSRVTCGERPLQNNNLPESVLRDRIHASIG